MTLTSIGKAPGEFTIFEARERASAPNTDPIRRAQPTGRCATGFETCPGLRGVFRCIDISSDIFSQSFSPASLHCGELIHQTAEDARWQGQVLIVRPNMTEQSLVSLANVSLRRHVLSYISFGLMHQLSLCGVSHVVFRTIIRVRLREEEAPREMINQARLVVRYNKQHVHPMVDLACLWFEGTFKRRSTTRMSPRSRLMACTRLSCGRGADDSEHHAEYMTGFW
jgi:hypothetical protein